MPDRVPNKYYKIVVRKFPTYMLKQKRAKKLNIINNTRLFES